MASTGHLKFMPYHIKKQLKSRQSPDEPREGDNKRRKREGETEQGRECATKSSQASETLKTRSAGSGSRGTKQIKIQLQMARAGNENET